MTTGTLKRTSPRARIALFIVAAMIALTILSGAADSGVSYAGKWSDAAIWSEYALGSEFSVPERTLTVGETTVTATSSLVFPDGSATRESKVILEQAGTYTLKYVASVDGKTFTSDCSFLVNRMLVSHGSDTTLGYGVPDNASTEGMLVNLAKDDKLTFSQYIDVSDVTKNDELIRMYVYPNNIGVADFDDLVITLTDAENPDVWLKLRGRRYRSGLCYFLAGGNGQPMRGREADNGKNILHSDNDFGMCTTISFDAKSYNWGTGNYDDVASDRYILSIRYDAESRGIYAECGHGSYGGQIIDLDSPSDFDTLWHGFPSGKAFLSVGCDRWNSSSANFCITDVMGTDITDYDGIFEDSESPELTVDAESDVLPEARIGGTYYVPSATAFDTYAGECDVDIAVWYGYGASNAVRIPITDGRFSTDYPGYYAIVYTTDDGFGNTAEHTLWVHAGGYIENIAVTLPQDRITSAELGEWVPVSAPDSDGISGGSGAKTVRISVSFEGTTTWIENGFRPDREGTWTVNYIAEDRTGGIGTASYTVSVVRGDKPILYKDPVLPRILISEAEYTLPEIYAADYTGGSLVTSLCDVTVTDANGQKRYAAGDTFVPSVTSDGDKITVSYMCGQYELYTAEIPTITAWVQDNGKKLAVENYFYGDDFIAEKSSDGIIFTAAGTDDFLWTFANTLTAESLSMTIGNVPGKSAFGALDIELCDSENSSVKLIGQLKNENGRTVFASGDIYLQLDAAFADTQQSEFIIGYEQKGWMLGKTRLPVSGFGGFPSGKVYLTVKASDVSGQAAFRMETLNGYPFTETTRDLVAPYIVIEGDYGGSFALGASYTVGKAFAGDVLSPVVTFGLTVTDPDGNIVTDDKGTKLENADPSLTYTFSLEKYGQYRVAYTAQEDADFVPRPNISSMIYAVNVEDGVAPEIKVSGKLPGSAKIGDIVKLPEFSVSDNVSPDGEIIVSAYVINPNGILLSLTESAIKCAYTGVYEFRITATDAAGNMSMVRLYVTVTE